MGRAIRPTTMLVLSLTACVAAAADEPVAFFEAKVRPLLIARCYECHAADESNGGLRLDSREATHTGGDTGPAVVPGDPDASLLIQAVRYTNPDLQMPPKGSLSEAEIAILEQWVAMGAPDPRTSSAPPATGPTGMSIEEGRTFWSFRAIEDPIIPSASDREEWRTPIDLFLDVARRENSLEPAPIADRRTLLRRVTLDLTGLPPAPAEMEVFLADESPDAFERVTDRLLASPGYGVRWGRHWLDVARYADSNGLDENLAYGHAWRYRDYVVDAFQRDKPFDQFVREQLAGDLLPDATPETKTATGFWVLGAKVLAEPDREKLVMDTVDEQLDTLGKTFWGMTLGCVRCHDHKFDPVKQVDYYGLAAILKSTKTFGDTNTGAIKHWNEYSFATAEETESLKLVEAEIAQLKKIAQTYKDEAYGRIREAARTRAADYLAAAARCEASATFGEISQQAEANGLHPRILWHTRQYIDFHQDDPFLAEWRLRAQMGDHDGIAAYYRELFQLVAVAREASAESPMPVDDRIPSARAALDDPSGFLALSPKPEFMLNPDELAKYHQLLDDARVFESSAPDEPAAMGVTEQTVLTHLPIHIRGNHLNLGPEVPRAFPAVMRPTESADEFSPESSGRLELARWATSPDHPLTARVYVNRIWRWHFGAGMVRTPDNFGKLGERPSHPELLDWLACRLMESGWSTKAMHRLILSSHAYRQSSEHPASERGEMIDPEDRLLWKYPRQRLDAEQIRDGILWAAGRLDDSIGGKSIPLRNKQFVFDHTSIDHTRYDSLRRALYLPVVRNNLYTLFEQFDFPDPTMPTGDRASTVIASQALLLMNADWVIASADDLARIIGLGESDPRERVRLAYERVLSRPATDAEVDRVLEFIKAALERGDEPTAAWSQFCQTLFAGNEFIDVR